MLRTIAALMATTEGQIVTTLGSIAICFYTETLWSCLTAKK